MTQRKKTTSSKIALLSDTHFGFKRGSQLFHEHFARFYDQTFFPFLDEHAHEIDTVVHLGDMFDVRKGIDYWSLEWAKKHFFEPLKKRNLSLHVLVGNHDSFYKNTLKINSLESLLCHYNNIHYYTHPSILELKGEKIMMVPWLCEDNREKFENLIKNEKARYCMGHFEINGFYPNPNWKCTTGFEQSIFDSFEMTFSGHFHFRSRKGKIHYLGNPYQMFWSDVNSIRGFHTMNLTSGELEFQENPYQMFYKIYYDDSNKDLNLSSYTHGFVKIMIEKKTNPDYLQSVIQTLTNQGCCDVKVVDNTNFTITEDIEFKSEDTLQSISNYIQAMGDNVNKEEVFTIMSSLYKEAYS